MPRKKYRAALQSALSARVAEGSVTVVSDIPLDQAKTKFLAKALTQLGVSGTVLLVMGEGRAEIVQAAKNLPAVTVVRPEDLNVYDVVRCKSIVIPERELARVKEAWS